MRVIGIVSGKGGVGKTTTAANLGAALANTFNKDVAVVDGNFATPNLALHYGMYHYTNTFDEALKDEIPIKQAIHTHPSGVKIIPSSLASYSVSESPEEFVKDLEEGIEIPTDPLIPMITTTSTNVKEALSELKEYEIILVDSAPGLEKESVPVLAASDEVLVITNPEIPALTDALKMIKMAESIGVKIFGVEVNRWRRERYELSIMEIESVCDAPVIAVIPESDQVRKSIAVGNPVVVNTPHTHAAVAFKKLAAKVIGKEYKPKVQERLR
ncbi:MAG: AAA family ATPase, partial [Halobacteriota archaeon]|nr:AAA family ATPase [Halobacteriota archaeon]